MNPPTNSANYVIDVIAPFTCTATKAVDHNSSRSNRAAILGGGGGQFILHQSNSNVKVYPNPTNDLITINIKGYSGPVVVEIYDLQGRLLEATNFTTVSLRKYERGIYIFKVSYGEITEEVRVVRD